MEINETDDIISVIANAVIEGLGTKKREWSYVPREITRDETEIKEMEIKVLQPDKPRFFRVVVTERTSNHSE